jgi:hypothetical protein
MYKSKGTKTQTKQRDEVFSSIIASSIDNLLEKNEQKVLKLFVFINHQNYIMAYSLKRSKEIELILLKLN